MPCRRMLYFTIPPFSVNTPWQIITKIIPKIIPKTGSQTLGRPRWVVYYKSRSAGDYKTPTDPKLRHNPAERVTPSPTTQITDWLDFVQDARDIFPSRSSAVWVAAFILARGTCARRTASWLRKSIASEGF